MKRLGCFLLAVALCVAFVLELQARPRPLRRAGKAVFHGTVKVGKGVKVAGRILIPPYRRSCR